MSFFNGLVQGVSQASNQAHAEQLSQDEAQRGRDQHIFELLLNSPDPTVQSMGLTGLLTPRAPSKGAKAFMGTAIPPPHPMIEQAMHFLQTPQTQTSIGNTGTTAPGELPANPPTGPQGPQAAGMGMPPAAPQGQMPQGATAAQPIVQPGQAPGPTNPQLATAPQEPPQAPLSAGNIGTIQGAPKVTTTTLPPRSLGISPSEVAGRTAEQTALGTTKGRFEALKQMGIDPTSPMGLRMAGINVPLTGTPVTYIRADGSLIHAIKESFGGTLVDPVTQQPIGALPPDARPYSAALEAPRPQGNVLGSQLTPQQQASIPNFSPSGQYRRTITALGQERFEPEVGGTLSPDAYDAHIDEMINPGQLPDLNKRTKADVRTALATNDPAAVQKAITRGVTSANQVTTEQTRANLPVDPQVVGYWASQIAGDLSKFEQIKDNKPLENAVRASLAQSGVDVDKISEAARQTGERARIILPQLDVAATQAKQLDQLHLMGPVSGRWREFLAGKIGYSDLVPGGTDPKTEALLGQFRSNVDILKPAIAAMHGGMRAGGSPAILGRLDDMLGQDKFDYAQFIGALEGVSGWAHQYAKTGTPKPVTPAAAPASAPGTATTPRAYQDPTTKQWIIRQ